MTFEKGVLFACPFVTFFFPVKVSYGACIAEDEGKLSFFMDNDPLTNRKRKFDHKTKLSLSSTGHLHP